MKVNSCGQLIDVHYIVLGSDEPFDEVLGDLYEAALSAEMRRPV